MSGLSDRLVRIRLVAWSYLDACESGGGTAEENVSSGSTESRAPSRNHELWHQASYGRRQNSYADLELALESLPPYVRLRFWVFYVRAKGPFRIYPEKHTHHAAFYRLARCMPKEVFVPAEISEAAGFLPAEAKTYSR